jgi:hypothetical protein
LDNSINTLFFNERGIGENKIAVFEISFIQFYLPFHPNELIGFEFGGLDLKVHFSNRFWSGSPTKETLAIRKFRKNNISISFDIDTDVLFRIGCRNDGESVNTSAL